MAHGIGRKRVPRRGSKHAISHVDLGVFMRRCLGLVCLGIVSCANPGIDAKPGVDGVPEDPGARPPLPGPPAHQPGPGFAMDAGSDPTQPSVAPTGGATGNVPADTTSPDVEPGYPSHDAGADFPLSDAGDAGPCSESLDSSCFSETSEDGSTDADGGAVNVRDAGG